MVSIRRRKHQKKNLPSQSNATLNDLANGNDKNADAIGNETFELQTSGLVKNFGRFSIDESSTNHDPVNERNFVDGI